MIDDRLVARLYQEAKGDRWRVDTNDFAGALETSAERAFAGRTPSGKELERYLNGLHLKDLALACACAAGDDEAWTHFVLEQRPLLYRAADAIDSTGGARDLADSLYADLFGLVARSNERHSLFRYFHGRSTIATWLRAILAQRHVDRLRSSRRTESLPDDESPAAIADPARAPELDRNRYHALMRKALSVATALLAPRDRLRLACYYAQELTLAQTGRVIGEHEATASRQLARTRRAIRESVENQLRTEHALTEAEVAECFRCVADDVGPIDLRDLFEVEPPGKESGAGSFQ